MTVTVRYFASLAEEAGTSEETVESSAGTVAELWRELGLRHPFTLDARLILAAQADEFSPWDGKLIPGQAVAFMPPVAGG